MFNRLLEKGELKYVLLIKGKNIMFNKEDH